MKPSEISLRPSCARCGKSSRCTTTGKRPNSEGSLSGEPEPLPGRGRFIGGRPMAGKEARGVEAADADLFRGRSYVLTGSDAVLEMWLEKIGARLVRLEPAEHDRLVALVSHLPQLLSTLLALLIAG